MRREAVISDDYIHMVSKNDKVGWGFRPNNKNRNWANSFSMRSSLFFAGLTQTNFKIRIVLITKQKE